MEEEVIEVEKYEALYIKVCKPRSGKMQEKRLQGQKVNRKFRVIYQYSHLNAFPMRLKTIFSQKLENKTLKTPHLI